MRSIFWVVLVLLAASPVPTRALDAWTPHDTGLELALVAAVVVDVGQTTGALADGFQEANPLLGRHPSSARLRSSAALAVLSHAAVAAVLPTRYRRWWQAVALGLEVGAVAHNLSVGARISF